MIWSLLNILRPILYKFAFHHAMWPRLLEGENMGATVELLSYLEFPNIVFENWGQGYLNYDSHFSFAWFSWIKKYC